MHHQIVPMSPLGCYAIPTYFNLPTWLPVTSCLYTNENIVTPLFIRYKQVTRLCPRKKNRSFRSFFESLVRCEIADNGISISLFISLNHFRFCFRVEIAPNDNRYEYIYSRFWPAGDRGVLQQDARSLM